MNLLPEKDRQALEKILALLASDKHGERDAAVGAATRLLDRHGMRWPDLLTLPLPPKREPVVSTWRTTCAELAKRPGSLRPWERPFVHDLPAYQRISTNQRFILNEISARILGRCGGA